MAATATKERASALSISPAAPTKSTYTAPGTDSTSAQPGSVGSRSLLVILHGKRVDDDLLRNALLELKQQGHQLTVRVTFDRGDVDHFIAEAVKLNDSGSAKYQTIVAGGGDGTLNEVVGALMQHREAIARQGLSIALIPLGTANDFACTAGISVDPKEALRLALDPSTIRPIDVATLNGKPFLNVAVAGGLAEVPADELSSKWKRLLGPVAIAFYVLKRLTSRKVLQPHAGATLRFTPPSRSKADLQQQQQQQSEHEFQTDLLMLVAGNSRQMGRTVAVCPDALLDDGLLDFTVLSGSSLATQAAALVSALASRDDHDSALDSGVCQLRASRLEVLAAEGSNGSSGDEIQVNRDGEPEPASHRLVFEVLHKALPMHLPDDRLLVSGQAASRTTSGFITGSIKHPQNDSFISATSAVPAAAAAVAGSDGGKEKGGKHRGSSKGSRRHKRKKGLTVKTLRRMLVVAGPEGQGVRTRARMVALGRSMATTVGVVLVGGVLGWVVGTRAAHAQQQQEEEQQEQHRAAEAATGAGAGAGAAGTRRGRREQRRAEGRRQSQGVAVTAVV